MEKALLIAEKPSLRRTIEKVYNDHRSEIPYEIKFMEQRGHLLTLKMPNELDEDLKEWDWDTLPIHPEEYGGWKYKGIEEKRTGKFLTAKERYQQIKDELKSGSYDFVINAGDPDQEGQLLVRIVLSALKCSIPIKRYWSNDTTEVKVLDALKHLRDDEKDPMLVNLLEAAYARQHSDWRYGINVSRAATLKMGIRCACGRVKTPILSIVCQREKDIATFTPTTVYGVKADYSEEFSGQLYSDSTAEEDEDEKDDAKKGLIWLKSEEEARDLIKTLSGPAKVLKFESNKVESYAPKLFKLASLQVAGGKHGYNSAQVLEIAQSLYEKGYLSYPRTDCEYLSSGEDLYSMLKSAYCVPELKPFISTISKPTIGKVLATKKWVNDAKLKESGHSALVPTTKKPDYSALTTDEQTIYRLVCRQFVAIFLPPLIQNKTELIADISGNLFKSTGKTLIDAGYTAIFEKKFTDMDIPEHKVGDVLTVDNIDIVTNTSTCPKRFTDADLIAACEAPHKFLHDKSLKALGKKLKIGTPATRASIISELIDKDKYLARKTEKKATYVVPTETGMIIYDNLKTCDICKVDMTGQWEEKLEAIRLGTLNRNELEEYMRHDVADMVEQIKTLKIEPVRRKATELCKCPSCDGVILSSPKGFYCSNYKEKDCKIGGFKLICDSKLTDDEFKELLDGKTITKKIKKGSTEWDQELFYDFTNFKVEFKKAAAKESAYDCPLCSEKLKDNGKALICDCGFKFWKTVSGKEIKGKALESLLTTGDSGLIEGFVSKAGKKYNAHLVIDEAEKRAKLSFED